MKFITALLLTSLLSFIIAPFSPWWIIAVVAFVVAAAIPQKTIFAFLSAALALFLLWGLQAFIIDSKNGHLLASKISDLFINRSFSLAVIFFTACIGAGVAGFAAISGSLFRKLIEKR